MTVPSPRAWGLLTRHVDTAGRVRTAPVGTVSALLTALGADRRRPEPDGAWPLVVVRGERRPLDRGDGLGPASSGEVELEGGAFGPAATGCRQTCRSATTSCTWEAGAAPWW